MGNRLTKIYTRTGDDGTTGLGSGERVPKDSLAGGGVRHGGRGQQRHRRRHRRAWRAGDVVSCLQEIQHQLFDLGGELAVPGRIVIDDAAVNAH